MRKSITVPEELYNKAAELAARDHITVEEFVSAVLANRLASREYIEARRSSSTGRSLSEP
jgi:hypothetical protein